MNPETLGKMIGSEKRVLILRIVGEQNTITASKCYQVFRAKHNPKIRREVIYRELECLRKGGILTKCYDAVQKKLCYSLKVKKISLDLCLMKIKIFSKTSDT